MKIEPTIMVTVAVFMVVGLVSILMRPRMVRFLAPAAIVIVALDIAYRPRLHRPVGLIDTTAFIAGNSVVCGAVIVATVWALMSGRRTVARRMD